MVGVNEIKVSSYMIHGNEVSVLVTVISNSPTATQERACAMKMGPLAIISEALSNYSSLREYLAPEVSWKIIFFKSKEGITLQEIYFFISPPSEQRKRDGWRNLSSIFQCQTCPKFSSVILGSKRWVTSNPSFRACLFPLNYIWIE